MLIQYLNLGISEANMLGMAAGMASCGKIPFAYTIGAFLAYRSYEFIRNDICLQKQNVKIVGTGAGQTYAALGPTHHTTEDLGGLRSLPNLVVVCPGSPVEVYKATHAIYEYRGPVYFRVGTNGEQEIYDEDYRFEIGKSVILREGSDIAIFSVGSILRDVIDVVDELVNEGIKCRVVNCHTLKPFDELTVKKAVDEIGRILTIEDHNVIGGVGSAVAEVIAEHGKGVKFKRLGLHDFSHGYGSYSQVKDSNNIGKENIEKSIRELLE